MNSHRSILSIWGLLIALGAVPAIGQTLTVTDGLQLWLKADAGITTNGEGNVVSWSDQSPNGNLAGAIDDASAPALVASALNGKPVLRFDGVDDYLSIPDADNLSFVGDLTTFFVVKFDDFATYRAVWAKTVNNLPAPTDYYTLPGSGIPRAYRGDGTFGSLGSADGSRALRAGEYITAGFDVSGTQVTHYISAQPNGGGTTPELIVDGETPLIIGSRADLFTKMKGDIAEIVLYDRTLTAEERAAVTGYLGTKYNIANLPPVVGLTAAPVGPAVPLGQVVTLTATATDPDGTVASVQFFANGTLFATASAPPYSAKVRLDTAGSYQFSARAIDNKDTPADSLPVTRTVAAAGGDPVLDVTSGLQLWLKADAGTTTNGEGNVVSWSDQSPNGNLAGAIDDTGAPALIANAVNGKPVLRFDGVDDYLSVPDADSLSFVDDMTTLFVVKFDDFATYRTVWAKTVNNQPAPTDFYTIPGSGLPQVYRGDGGAVAAPFLSTTALSAGNYLAAGFSMEGTTCTHYSGGRATSVGTIDLLEADGDTPLLIGTRADFVTRMKGDIAEVVIYDRALTGEELGKAQLYLATKYALPFTTAVNDVPTAAVTSPAGGASFVAPTDVAVTATAGDTDGSVVRVEFLVNGAIAATDTTAPYSATITFPVASAATLVARAIDNLGGIGLSAPVAISVTATEPIPLPAVASLKLWLRADKGVTEAAGAVSQWSDQSGNFNNTLQADGAKQPLLVADAVNAKPALRFDGLDDQLAAPSSPSLAITGDISSFFVVRFDDFATFRAVWAKTQGNLPASTDFYTLPDSGIPRVFRGNGGGGLGNVDAVQAPLAGEPVIIGFDMGGTTLRHYLNGGPNGEGEIGAVLADTGAPLWIGTRGDQFTRMKGDIAEIIIYDSALSATDLAAVFAYLGTRYGIPIVAPEEPPVLTIIPSAGNTVTVSWPTDAVGWTLKSSTSLATGSWEVVPDVVDNSVTQAIDGLKFYRLEK